MVERLSDIVKQTRSSCKSRVHAKLARHNSCQMCHLYGVIQHVLTVGGSVLKPSYKPYKLVVQAVYVCFQYGSLALLLYAQLHLSARLLNRFLNARGVNTPVLNEPFESYPRYLSANVVKAGKRDNLRRVVNDKINARHGFESANIAPLAPDYTPLHFVARDSHYRNSCFGYRIRCQSCDGKGYVLPCLLITVVLELLLISGYQKRLVMVKLRVKQLQKVILRLLRGKARYSFQNIHLALLELLRFGYLFVSLLVLLVELLLQLFKLVVFLVEIFLLLLYPALRA